MLLQRRAAGSITPRACGRTRAAGIHVRASPWRPPPNGGCGRRWASGARSSPPVRCRIPSTWAAVFVRTSSTTCSPASSPVTRGRIRPSVRMAVDGARPLRIVQQDEPGLLTPWFAVVLDQLQRWLDGGTAAVPAPCAKPGARARSCRSADGWGLWRIAGLQTRHTHQRNATRPEGAALPRRSRPAPRGFGASPRALQAQLLVGTSAERSTS